jgi:O-antigen/teichoic acid export membrane protein
MTIFTGFASVILIVFTFLIDNIIRIPLIHKKHLIGAEYWSGVYIVPIILFSYLMYGIYINLMAGIFIEKKTKYLPYITGAGVIINIAGNFLLIPPFGMYGAAIATFLSYFVMMVYIYYISEKFYHVKYEVNKIILLFIVNFGAIIFFYLMFYGILPSNIFLKFVLMILLAGAVIYLSGLTKAKVLLKKSAPIKGESRDVDVQDEFIP